MKESVLLIEDDSEIIELLSIYLNRQGFDVASCRSGADALKLLRAKDPDLVILDVMLPGKGGLEVCREIREESPVPILILSARGEPMDRVRGLELGADDYMAKPFEPRELLARMQSILRRAGAEKREVARLCFEGLEIDLIGRSVRAHRQVVDLSSSEYEALLLLARQPGKVVTREALVEHLRGRECEAFGRSVDTLISRLRTKLRDDPQKPRFIKTVWGDGYVFINADASRKS